MGTRPKYERKEDIQCQDIIANTMMSYIPNMALQKQPEYSHTDYLAYNIHTKKLSAIIEIKVRYTSYDTLKISKMKWDANVVESHTTGIPFYLVIAWPVQSKWEVLMTPFIPSDAYNIDTNFGRTYMRDAHDREVAVIIPRAAFHRIGYVTSNDVQILKKNNRGY